MGKEIWFGYLIIMNLAFAGLGLASGEIRSVGDAAAGLAVLAFLDVILGGAGAFMFGGREE